MMSGGESTPNEALRLALAQRLARDGGRVAGLLADQQRSWMLQQLEREAPTSVAGLYRLDGPLDLAVLQQAVATLGWRYGLLRSTFLEVGGRPVRVVGSYADLPLRLLDLAGTDESSRLASLRAICATELTRPFDLGAGPLARFCLGELAEDSHVLLLVLHETIADEWAPDTLSRELFDGYAAMLHGAETPGDSDAGEADSTGAATNFDAAVVAERHWLASAPAQQSMTFWRHTLDGVPPLRMPLDHPRPAVKSHRSGTLYQPLDRECAAALRQCATWLGLAPEVTLLAGYSALLSRYSQQDDIAVGIRLAGPPDVFGPRANTVVIRSRPAPETTAASFLRQVADRYQQAAGHARMPFSHLVDALNPSRDLSRTPLCQALFTAREDFSPMMAAGLSVRSIPLPVSSTAYDLALTLLSGSTGGSLRLTYDADLFEIGTVERLLARLQAILVQFSRQPEQALAEIPLADRTEVELITGAWNATEQPSPADSRLHELVSEQARLTPSAVAVSDSAEQLRYRDLDEQANQLAHRLIALGVTPESRVALCLRRSVQMVVAMLGVLKAGAAYVPLDAQYPTERLSYLLSDSDSAVLLTETALLDRLPSHQVRTVLLDAEWGDVVGQPRTDPAVDGSGGSLAYLIYTSGSTGNPKGVLLTHRGIVNNLRWRQRNWPLRPGERVLQNHPFSFDPSVWATFWPLTMGAECVISPPAQQLDAGALVRLIRDQRIVLYGAVPSVNGVLMEEPTIGECTSLRYVLSGAEPLTTELQRSVFSRLDASVSNLYGPTETTIDATWWDCPRTNHPQPAPIGRPIDNLRVYLLDRAGQLVPPGMPGEICVAGVGLARGYHRQSGLTANRFIPDPFSATPGGRLYRTGDLGRWRPDGVIEFLGRADQQVKVRGFRVELAEIEAVLRMVGGVREAAVAAWPDAQNGNRLVAYVVPEHPADPPTRAELAAFVAEVLPAYMVPASFVWLAELPLGANGKLDRRGLPAPPAETEPTDERVAPRTPLEAEIAQAFAAVLDVAEVGVEDDFFASGGTSIMLARLASRLLAQYELQIPVHQFFKVPTVAGVASVVEVYNRAGIAGVMAEQHATRLDEDAQLPDDIEATGLPSGNHTRPQAVLLTGATGYLGAFLLAELLRESTADVYCLVRAGDKQEAFQRIQDSLRRYLIHDPSQEHRILPLVGDLAEPRLGLSEAEWHELAEQVEVIYHNGALVNFVYPYSALRGPNVQGTQEVLRLACTTLLKAVHYVSTIDVLLATHSPRPFLEDDSPLRNPVEVPGGYTGSKWVAEKMVHLASERGIPVAIYRPGLIMSHTTTGATQTSDYLLVAFRGYLPMRILPDYPRIFDTVPVDYVAQSIVRISLKPEIGGFYHLFNPAPVSIRRFCEWIQSYGYDFDIVPFEEARRRALEVGPGHALYPLVPLIRDAEANPQPSLDPAFIEQLQPDEECRNTLAALADTGVACPPMTEEMAHRCLAYLIEVGFLPEPETAVAEPVG